MSKGGRIGLIVAALAVAVVAFAVLQPGDEDDPPGAGAGETAREPLPPGEVTEIEPTATAPSAPDPPPDGPAPASLRVELRDYARVGEVQTLEVTNGDRVRLVVISDRPDDIHVHGYDVELSVGPGTPQQVIFEANLSGIFEIESHEAEHQGEDPLIARLVVEPS